MKAADLHIRGLRPGDREALGRFTCSTGEPWEDLVEEQIHGPLPLRYLDTPSYFDGRMLLGFGPAGDLLVVGAHHIEPLMVPDVGYTEVIAVALSMFAPYAAEDMWEKLGYQPSVAQAGWRKPDPTLLVEDSVVAVVDRKSVV